MTDTQATWLRDNLFVVAALALPLIVVIFFLGATGLSTWLVDDPRYDLVLSIYSGTDDPEFPLKFFVDGGQVVAAARLSGDVGGNIGQRLYVYESDTGVLRRIIPTIPDPVQSTLREQEPPALNQIAPSERFVVAELAELHLYEGPIAPDGYQMRADHPGSGGLFGDLFGMDGRHQRIAIVKSGRKITLPVVDDHRTNYFYGTEALGWLEQ